MYKITVYWIKLKHTDVYKVRTLKEALSILDDYSYIRDVKIKIKQMNGGKIWKK